MPSLVYTNQMEYQRTTSTNLPDILQLFLLVFFVSCAWRIGYSQPEEFLKHTSRISIMTVKILCFSISGFKHKALTSSSILSLGFQLVGPDAISPETTVGPIYIRPKVTPLCIIAQGVMDIRVWILVSSCCFCPCGNVPPAPHSFCITPSGHRPVPHLGLHPVLACDKFWSATCHPGNAFY